MLPIAFAHQSAVKYLDLVIDGETIAARMTVAPSDLAEPLGLAPDAQPTVIAAATPAAARYTRDWVAVGACTPSAAHAAPDLDARFVAVTWTLTCPSLGAELDLDLSAFFTADSRHEAIVRVDGRDPIVVRSSTPRWSIPVGDQKFPWGWWVVIPGAVLGLGGVLLLRRRAT